MKILAISPKCSYWHFFMWGGSCKVCGLWVEHIWIAFTKKGRKVSSHWLISFAIKIIVFWERNVAKLHFPRRPNEYCCGNRVKAIIIFKAAATLSEFRHSEMATLSLQRSGESPLLCCSSCFLFRTIVYFSSHSVE